MKALTFQEAIEALIEKLAERKPDGSPVMQPAHRALACQTGVSILAFVFEEHEKAWEYPRQILEKLEARLQA